jgi:hypothetical protein
LGAIFGRIVALIIGLSIVFAAVVASFAFLCYALFALLSTYLSPPLAAFLTALAFLLIAALVLLILFAITRPRKRVSDHVFAAGEVLGAIVSQKLRGITAKSITASIVASLIAGLIVGARATRGRRKK